MKLALVTGGNRGIGFAVCRGLAKRGVKVLLGSRDEQRGLEASGKLRDEGLDVSSLCIDVSDKAGIAKAAEEIHESFGALDILVNNAATFTEGSLLELSDEQLALELETNLWGPIHCIRLFSPPMVKQGYGRIVNVSSGSGSFQEGLSGPAAYSISKAALNAATVKAAQALPSSVKVNAVCPGWVSTRMGGPAAPRSPEEGAETILWLAALSDEGPTGKFFRDRRQIGW